MSESRTGKKNVSTGVWVLRGVAIAVVLGISFSLYSIVKQTSIAGRFSSNKIALKQLGLSVNNYHDTYNCLVTSTKNAEGLELQSWQTILIPSVVDPGFDFYRRDFQQPWNAEIHREFFQSVVPWYLSTSMDHKTDPATGYALTGFSANKHLIDFGPPVKFDDIKDGLATTLLIGEIRDELPPWGKPGNSRDPALGINKSPKGFGGTFYNGCLFSMADGSVRHISEKVDTKVIEALGTPAGGETLKEGEF